MAKLETLVDTFDDNVIDSTLWTSFSSNATIEERQGKIHIVLPSSTVGSNYALIESATTYTLVASYGFVEFSKLADLTTNAQTYFKLFDNADSTDYLIWILEAGQLAAKYSVNGVLTTVKTVDYSFLDIETYRWLKISEASGRIYWSYSSDGETWNNFTDVATPITVTAVIAELGGGTYQSEVNPGAIVMDNFNFTPVKIRDKKFLYKVYDSSGTYLDTLTDVITEPTFTQEINLPSSEMVLRLARNPDDFDEGNTVAFDNIIKIYVKDYETTNFQFLFQGRIVAYKPIFGVDEGIEITLYSLGERLDNMIYGLGGTVEQTQDTGTSETSFGSDIQIAQSFIPDVAGLSFVDVYVGCLTPSTIVNLEIRQDSSSQPASTAITNGSTFATTTSSTPTKLHFRFGTSLTLTVGTTYWMVLS
jgi:hypothetical protein